MPDHPSQEPPIKPLEQIREETKALAELLRIADPKRGLTPEQKLQEVTDFSRRQIAKREAEKRKINSES